MSDPTRTTLFGCSRTGGVILWHDYDFIHPAVFRLINEIAREKEIFYIERTRFALFMAKDACASGS